MPRIDGASTRPGPARPSGDRILHRLPLAPLLRSSLVVAAAACSSTAGPTDGAADGTGAPATSACAGRRDTTKVPLTDLGAGCYLSFQGGLYPGGANDLPAAHLAAGVSGHCAAMRGPCGRGPGRKRRAAAPRVRTRRRETSEPCALSARSGR